MTIRESFKNSIEKLSKTSPSPRLDAEVLLTFVLNKSKEFLYTYTDKELTEKQKKVFNEYVNKRIEGHPIAHITGHKEFYGIDFNVTPDTLIPRPGTELVVDYIIQNSSLLTQNSTLIDIGTGTGCIPISIIKKLQVTGSKLQVIAIDISKKALKVARKNAKKHRIEKNIRFIHGDLLEPILKTSNLSPLTSHLIITGNLPYLTPEQIKSSPSIQKEPALALIAGEDGLKYYKQLFTQINSLIKMLRVPCCVLCEIDDSQTKKISQLIKNELPDFIFEIKKDLNGQNRLVIIKSKVLKI